MKISTILDKVDENQLRVPAFQREYVWKRDDVKELVDSLIKEYPTGTLLTWETNNPPDLKGPEQYHESQGSVKLLLDGQQRVTSLYILSRGEIPPYYTQDEITNDVTGLHINLETCELSYFQKIRMEGDPRWCSVTDILQKKTRSRDVIKALEAGGVEVTAKLDDLIDDNFQRVLKILDLDFPEQTVPIHATVQEAIEIFYKVNASGVALTAPELALAQISGYWPEARAEFKAKLDELAESGFVFDLNFIVYALLACMYHRGSAFELLHSPENSDRIREVWARLRDETIDYVCNVLKSRAYVDHSSEMVGYFAVIPMVAYCFDHEGPSDIELRKMTKWFLYTQLRLRYVKASRTQLDRDLKIIESEESPFDILLGVIEESSSLTVTPDELMARGVQSEFFALMRWMLRARGAVCLSTGVGLQINMGTKYQLEREQIFPYAELKTRGYGANDGHKFQLVHEIANRMLLASAVSRSRAESLPSAFLPKVEQQFPGALELQCIPTNPQLWEIDRFEDFLRERRELLASAMNEFLEGITETDPVPVPISLEARIESGETDDLEFKSSMIWSYNDKKHDKPLMGGIIMRAIAAFANGEGGTLVIGVDDDGEPLGLERDLEVLKKRDKDGYELYLRELLNNKFKSSQVSQHISISFPEVEGVEVCKVDVGRATEAWYVEYGKNPTETLFVRSGNGVRAIPPSEIHAYEAERFGS